MCEAKSTAWILYCQLVAVKIQSTELCRLREVLSAAIRAHYADSIHTVCNICRRKSKNAPALAHVERLASAVYS